jgi:ACR3 family arsenite efflux pump ArsB
MIPTPKKYEDAAPAEMIGAFNYFEVAIATAHRKAVLPAGKPRIRRNK